MKKLKSRKIILLVTKLISSIILFHSFALSCKYCSLWPIACVSILSAEVLGWYLGVIRVADRQPCGKLESLAVFHDYNKKNGPWQQFFWVTEDTPPAVPSGSLDLTSASCCHLETSGHGHGWES